MTYMLDTNICIYIINKRPAEAVKQLARKMNAGIAISAITLAELEFGVANSDNRDRRSRGLDKFLTIPVILPFDQGAATEFGTIRADLRRKGTPIGHFDELIAAHAKSQGLILVTNNMREFKRVEGLKLENWVDDPS